MGNCNGCGDCCDPVVLPLDRFVYILGWANRPAMDEDPELYKAAGFNVDDPEVVAQAATHIANGKFAREHWREHAEVRMGDPLNGEVVRIFCPFFDKEARTCGAYDERPPICQGFPWYSQDPMDFISKNPLHMSTNCSYWEDVPVTFRPRGWTLRRQWKA